MGMGGGIWQPQGSYAGKEAGASPEREIFDQDPSRGLGGASGRGSTWDAHKRIKDKQQRRYAEEEEEVMQMVAMILPELVKMYL